MPGCASERACHCPGIRATGRQAARGTESVASLDGAADLVIEDDRATGKRSRRSCPDVAARCDLLLGPYSTQLMRAAGRLAAESDGLIWNHGGSGDDVEARTPATSFPCLRRPAVREALPAARSPARRGSRRDLYIVHGPGSFGRQVADGAERLRGGLASVLCVSPLNGSLPPPGIPADWDLFSAGVFEQDAETSQPRHAVARPAEAGVCRGRRCPRLRPGRG